VKIFPNAFLKILPAALLSVITFGLSAGCQTSTSVEASTTRVPVVAPAGTVLRVRLSESLDSRRSRPGDRFIGLLDSPVMAGTIEVLPRGTVVEGHVLTVRGAGKDREASLAVTLDSCQFAGRRYWLATSAVERVGRGGSTQSTNMTQATNRYLDRNVTRVSLSAESIIGFTLTKTLAA
jgi:hypothetical protein